MSWSRVGRDRERVGGGVLPPGVPPTGDGTPPDLPLALARYEVVYRGQAHLFGAVLLTLVRLVGAMSAPFLALRVHWSIAIVLAAVLCYALSVVHFRDPHGGRRVKPHLFGLTLALIHCPSWRYATADYLIHTLWVFAMFALTPWWVAIIVLVTVIWAAPELANRALMYGKLMHALNNGRNHA